MSLLIRLTINLVASFVQNLRAQINLEEIDYIIINHAEEDHAGALTELMSLFLIPQFIAQQMRLIQSMVITITLNGILISLKQAIALILAMSN